MMDRKTRRFPSQFQQQSQMVKRWRHPHSTNSERNSNHPIINWN